MRNQQWLQPHPSDNDLFTDFIDPYFGVEMLYLVPATELRTD